MIINTWDKYIHKYTGIWDEIVTLALLPSRDTLCITQNSSSISVYDHTHS